VYQLTTYNTRLTLVTVWTCFSPCGCIQGQPYDEKRGGSKYRLHHRPVDNDSPYDAVMMRTKPFINLCIYILLNEAMILCLQTAGWFITTDCVVLRFGGPGWDVDIEAFLNVAGVLGFDQLVVWCNRCKLLFWILFILLLIVWPCETGTDSRRVRAWTVSRFWRLSLNEHWP
jgi:hypothetical protein